MYKQCIVVRKDLNMSIGKICSQVSHASMAFLTNMIRKNAYRSSHVGRKEYYKATLNIDTDTYEEWIDGALTKCFLQAKNKNQLLKAKTMAEEMGMKEGEDFFCIYDECRTELTPEFIDDQGVGRVLTCIGFRPMSSEVIDKIGKKYQLYK